MKWLKSPIFIGLVVVASAVAFFAAALSTLPLWPKVAACLLILVLSGFSLHKLTGVDSFYGFLIVRSLAGFDLMKAIAKRYPNLLRQAADTGATMAFGIPFGIRTFGWSKALAHALVFAVFLYLMNAARFVSALSFLLPSGEGYFILAGLLFGLAGMGLLGISVHAFRVLTVPNTPAGVSVLIPGVTVPWEALFGIVILAVVHEMAHGVLCYIEKLPLKSSGVLLFGFLPVGAFVEPDEEKLDRVSLVKKRRILVAGSASNCLFFVLFFLLAGLLSLLIFPLVSGVAVTGVPDNSTLSGLVSSGAVLLSVDGVPVKNLEPVYSNVSVTHNPVGTFDASGKNVSAPLMDLVIASVNASAPASSVLSKGMRISAVDGKRVSVPTDVAAALSGKTGGQSVILTTNAGNRTIQLADGGKIGIVVAFAPSLALDNRPKAGFEILYAVLSFVLVLFSFTYLLNLLIAIINLLPMFVTDGQKMIYYELEPVLKKERAAQVSMVLGFAVVGILLINALPYFWH